MTEDQAERLADTREPPAIDRQQEKDFRGTRAPKDLPCVAPGCTHRFRPSTQYMHFLGHLERQHGKKVGP